MIVGLLKEAYRVKVANNGEWALTLLPRCRTIAAELPEEGQSDGFDVG